MSVTTRASLADLSQEIIDMICEHLGEPYKPSRSGGRPYVWRKAHSLDSWRSEVANIRRVSRGFAIAGHRLLFRWICASLRRFYKQLGAIAHEASFGFARTVQNVRIHNRDETWGLPSKDVADILNCFKNLTYLEIECWDTYFSVPNCLTISMFAYTNLPSLTHLTICAAGTSGWQEMLSHFQVGNTTDKDLQWVVANTAILKTFSGLKYLSMETRRMDRAKYPFSYPAFNIKAMLFIASMASNVEDLMLDGLTLDDNIGGFELAKNAKLRHLCLQNVFWNISDIRHPLANCMSSLESLEVGAVLVEGKTSLSIMKSLLHFPKLSRFINRLCSPQLIPEGDPARSDLKEALNKLKSHLNANCRRNNLAPCSIPYSPFSEGGVLEQRTNIILEQRTNIIDGLLMEEW